MKDKDVDIIKNEVKTHIDTAMERYVVSKYSEWSGLMAQTRDEILELKSDVKRLETTIIPLIDEAQFWGQFWSKVKQGGNILTWTVGVIAAILILTGQAKTIILAWLASRVF